MRIFSALQTDDHSNDPHRRVKITLIVVCALLGAFVAGSWAPTVEESMFNGVRNYLRTVSSEKEKVALLQAKQELLKAKNGSSALPAATASTQEPGTESLPPDDHMPFPYGHTFAGILPFAILGAMLGAKVGDLLIDFLSHAVDRWNKMEPGDKVTAFLGVVAGIMMSFPFLVIFQSQSITGPYVPWLMLILTLSSITLSIYILQSISEFFPWNKNRGPSKRRGIKLLDTSVIIDGRIYDVAQNGFLEGQLYVPQFVLEELQHIADHHDPLRRQRGKRGLEVLRHLQADFPLEVGSQDKLAPEIGDPVDSRLVRLARAMGADLVTNDHNLNRVAALQDVKVLNLNDLALALRPNVLPQETLSLALIREGNQPGQGVGYLDDGTMVVVENGRNHIGETVDVEVTQVIQTERGKMIFGEVDKEEEVQPQSEKKRPATPKRY